MNKPSSLLVNQFYSTQKTSRRPHTDAKLYYQHDYKYVTCGVDR